MPRFLVTALAVLSFAPASSAAPRLAVFGFTGPGADGVAVLLADGFRRAGGLDVLGPDVTAPRVVAAAPRPGWLDRPEEVRRILAKIDADLLVSGRVWRERGKDMVIVFLRAARTGRVVSAARVERASGFEETAVRMTLRLRNLAFAALSLPSPAATVAEADTEPPPDEEPTATAPPPVVALAPTPTAPLPAPTPVATPEERASVAVSTAAPPPAAPPLLLFSTGFGYTRWARGDAASGGMVLRVDAAVFPGAQADAGRARDFGIALAFETGLKYAALSDGSSPEYLRGQGGLTYRFRLGAHELHTLAAYELRDFRVRTAAGSTTRDHRLVIGVSAVLDLGASLRLAPALEIVPVGAHAGPAGHGFGIGGGLAFYAEISAAVVGVFYRGEYLRGAADAPLSGAAFDDVVHTVGAFGGFRY